MPFPNQDYSERDFLLPAGCKDLMEAMRREQQSAIPRNPEPEITRWVTLPEKVSIGYLAELTGQQLCTIINDLCRLRLFLGIYRSLDFESAARLLEQYGVGALREGV